MAELTEQQMDAAMKRIMAAEETIKLVWELGQAEEIRYDQKQEAYYFLRWSPRENTGDDPKYLSVGEAYAMVMARKPELLSEPG